MPDALKAVISLSEDNFPNVISVVTSTAIGIANEIIHAEFKIRNLIIISNDRPLPRNLSRFFNMNWDNKTNIRINKVVKNGVVNSFKMYLWITFTNNLWR